MFFKLIYTQGKDSCLLKIFVYFFQKKGTIYYEHSILRKNRLQTGKVPPVLYPY